MDRSIIDPMEQMRSFDFVQFEHDVLLGLGALAQDFLSGLPSGTQVVGGLAAAQTSPLSLSMSVAAGRIYTLAVADTVAVGAITADPTVVCQQGQSLAQTLTLVPPAAGQSQWNLVQGQFQQGDAVRVSDPSGGIVPFYNAANPAVPTPASINTVRQGRLVLQVVQGAAAVTGSEVPPLPSSNWVPLYLIDMVGGQTTVNNSQILRAGPTAGINVPQNYPVAPFVAGLLAAHHSGAVGQAPKISLATEVQGILPYSNMSPVRQLLGSNLTLYVNASTGVDTNNGLTPNTAFKTVQAAVNSAFHNYDYNGFVPTISVANGTYANNGLSAVVFMNGLPLGAPAINITGNIGSPGSVTFTGTLSAGVIVTACTLNLAGVTVTATGSGVNGPNAGYGIVAAGAGWCNTNVVVLGSCTSGQVLSEYGSVFSAGGNPITFTGTTPSAFSASVGSTVFMTGATITLTGLTATIVANASLGGSITIPGVTWVGSATGQRYNVSGNAVISTGGGGANYIPGTVAGATSTGGQYV